MAVLMIALLCCDYATQQTIRTMFFVPFLLTALNVHYLYFDGFSPRPLTYEGLTGFKAYYEKQMRELPRY
jgi:hypothetical protein